MDKFITVTADISQDAFEYLYKYSLRMNMDISSAINSIILFDESPVETRDKKEYDGKDESERQRCRLFIAEMLKDGDKESGVIIRAATSAGFSQSKAQRSMGDVSDFYYKEAKSIRRLKVDMESLRDSCNQKSVCRFCGSENESVFGKSGMCDGCKREYHRVLANNSRARRLGLICDLTLEEWIGVLRANDGKCAYCGGNFEEMDHIIQIEDGGGTTVGNVAPSCKRCNLDKKKIGH